MNTWEVLRRPIVTEKTTILSESRKYAFEVHKKATKPQIRRAVEDLYGVRVLSVATQNRKGQLRRNKLGQWRAKKMKQAIVKIHAEDKIELF